MRLRILLLLVMYLYASHVSARDLPYTPYASEAVNVTYNRLFCDVPELYQSYDSSRAQPWKILFTKPLDIKALRLTAVSAAVDTRLRILAFNLLKQHHALPKKKQLLGVIVEVGLEKGLDTLAAYSDKSVSYINQSGKLHEWEVHSPDIDAKIHKLFQETQPIIEKIGPWHKSRLPPPTSGQMRLTFLVSDGLYFGEGTMRDMSRSPLAGPVLTAATELLYSLIRQ